MMEMANLVGKTISFCFILILLNAYIGLAFEEDTADLSAFDARSMEDSERANEARSYDSAYANFADILRSLRTKELISEDDMEGRGQPAEDISHGKRYQKYEKCCRQHCRCCPYYCRLVCAVCEVGSEN